jgi:hypothetical protein
MTDVNSDKILGPERPDALTVALNLLPLTLIGLGAALAVRFASGGGAFALFIIWLYVAPALAGGAVSRLWRTPTGTFRITDAGYRHWWLMLQLQMPFNRLPILEDALRLVPGLYPAWIALWGGKLSALALVGPGVLIVDRHLISVGRGAVLGVRAGFSGHLATRDESGRWEIIVAPCEVGADAIVGAEAGMGPGASLGPGAVLPAGRRLGPYRRWPKPIGGTSP